MVYVVLFLLAPFISNFYGIEILKDITRIYGIILLLHSLTVVQVAKLTSEMRFKLQFIISLISLICGGITGIIMAYRGCGVWSIVFQSLINALVSVLLLWTLTGWRPILCFSKKSFNYLFSFGSKMLTTSIIDVIYDNIYALTIGKFYTPQSVGYFTRGQQMINIPQSSVTQIVTKVSLPLLTPLQDNNQRLLVTYEKIFRLTLFAVYPLVMYILIFSDSIISVLLKEKWMPCVPYLRILSFGALWYPLTLINVNLIIVKGRSDILLKIDVYKKLIGFAIVLITLNIGIYWMCFGTTIYALCAFIINCQQTKTLLNYGFVEQIKIVVPTLIRTLLMGLALYYGCSFIQNDYVRLFVGAVLGALVYLFICIVTKDIAYNELLKIVRRK